MIPAPGITYTSDSNDTRIIPDETRILDRYSRLKIHLFVFIKKESDRGLEESPVVPLSSPRIQGKKIYENVRFRLFMCEFRTTSPSYLQ